MSDNLFNIFLHTHSGSWALIPIFFIISCIFLRQKVTSMILRLLYLIMIITGIGMLIKLDFPLEFTIKGILAFILIGIMEKILALLREKKSTVIYWVIWVILIVLIPLMGYQTISF